MFENIKNDKENSFYKVDETAISSAQEDLGIILPEGLIDFYKNVGYGFLKSDMDNINRVMDPISICDFRFREGPYEYMSDLQLYEACERESIIFFEICESSFLSIGFSKRNAGKIFYMDRLIADSLTEFLDKYQNNESFLDE